MTSFWGELKRRNVVRVAIAYAVVAWLLVEVASVVLPTLLLPDWTLRILVLFVILGFPLALIFAWAFELTPEGLKKEKDVDRSESITHITGRELFSWPVRDMKDKRHTDSELKPRKNFSCIGKFT